MTTVVYQTKVVKRNVLPTAWTQHLSTKSSILSIKIGKQKFCIITLQIFKLLLLLRFRFRDFGSSFYLPTQFPFAEWIRTKTHYVPGKSSGVILSLSLSPLSTPL